MINDGDFGRAAAEEVKRFLTGSDDAEGVAAFFGRLPDDARLEGAVLDEEDGRNVRGRFAAE